jgi:hypothetical protein
MCQTSRGNSNRLEVSIYFVYPHPILLKLHKLTLLSLGGENEETVRIGQFACIGFSRTDRLWWGGNSHRYTGTSRD